MNHDLASDVLERQFGSTQVQVLHEDAHSRLVQVSAAGTGEVLELARSTFNNHTIARYPEVHKYIFGGHAMGKTFEQFGIDFRRVTRLVRNQLLPPAAAAIFASDEPATVVLVDIFVGPAQLHYAQILEVYGPQVTWPDTATDPEPGSSALADQLISALAEVLQ